jgi:hypothetical protein
MELGGMVKKNHTPHRPRGRLAAEGRAPVVDLEPVARTVVVLDRPGGLGHVPANRATSQLSTKYAYHPLLPEKEKKDTHREIGPWW